MVFLKKIVSVSDLKVGYILQESIKTRDGKDLVTKGSVLTESIIERLRNWYAKDDCMISVDDDNIDNVDNSDSIDDDVMEFDAAKFKEVQDKTIRCLEDVFSCEEEASEVALNTLKPYALSMSANLKGLADIPKKVLKEQHVSTKAGHCFRVAEMVVVLTNLYNNNLPKDKKISLETVCMAALLHEYGKKFEDDVVTLSRLKRRAASVFKKKFNDFSIDSNHHTAHAYLALKDKVSDDVRLTILGRGIPAINGKNSSKKWIKGAQIIFLCDTYDTLLESVLEKDMLSPFENVISFMGQLAHNNSLDGDLYKLFLKHIPLYTDGEKVLLSSGEYAVVINRSEAFPTKPVVLTLPPDAPKLIDLSKTTNIVIRRIVQSEEETANKVSALQKSQTKNIEVSESVDTENLQEKVSELLVQEEKEKDDVPKSFVKSFFRKK